MELNLILFWSLELLAYDICMAYIVCNDDSYYSFPV